MDHQSIFRSARGMIQTHHSVRVVSVVYIDKYSTMALVHPSHLTLGAYVLCGGVFYHPRFPAARG